MDAWRACPDPSTITQPSAASTSSLNCSTYPVQSQMRFKNKQKIQQTTIMATMEDKRDDGSMSKACSYHNYLRLVDPRIQQSVEASAPPIQRAERPVAPIFPTMTVTAEPSRVQAAWKQANALHSAEGSPKPPRRVSTYSAAQVEPVVRRPRRVSTEPTHARHEKNKAKAKSDSDHSDVEFFRKRKITRRALAALPSRGRMLKQRLRTYI